MKNTLLAVAITFAVTGCGGDGDSTPAPRVPDYVPLALRQESSLGLTPPQGYSAAIFWGRTIHDNRRAGTSEVKVDWQRLYCRVGTQTVLVDENEFGQTAPGGVCSKDPWCPTGIVGGALPVVIDQRAGTATLVPSSSPDQGLHWWGSYPRALVPANADRCWTEARLLISGPALVQIGFDWYPNPTAAPETSAAGALSDWASESPQWQILSVGKP